jgi:hypothetical protein
MISRGRMWLRLIAMVGIAASLEWGAPSVAQAGMVCPMVVWVCNMCPSNKQQACNTQCMENGGPSCFGDPGQCEITSNGGCSTSSTSLVCLCAEQ